jgi:hypothetical protein
LELLEMIQTYQTLIVGLIGFVGVMVTLWWNARLQREQEERRERRGASALRRALIEELKQQRKALQVRAENLAKAASDSDKQPDGTKSGTLIPLERYDSVFTASRDKLGLLDDSQLEAVFKAYLPLPRPTWQLRMLAQPDEPGMFPPEKTDFLYVLLEGGHKMRIAGKMHAELLPSIDRAIAELRRGSPGADRTADDLSR